MKKITIALCILLTSYFSTFSQNAPNAWNEYFAFNSVKKIEYCNPYIVALTVNGIFIYNEQTHEVSKITKLQKLSSVNLTTMSFNSKLKKLVIGYADGSIDVIEFPNKNITNISTITKRNIYGSKSIQNICFSNDTAFIATDFGLITFNLSTNEFIHTAILGLEGEYIGITDVDIDTITNTLYAASENGIYYISTNKNISDVSLWSKLSNIPHANEHINDIAYYNNALYYSAIDFTDTIYKISNSIVSPFLYDIKNIQKINSKNNNLCITANSSIRIYKENEILQTIIDTSNTNKSLNCRDVCITKNNSIWIADGLRGIYSTSDFEGIYPAGPLSNIPSEVVYKNDKLYVVSGNSNAYQNGMYNVLINNKWYGHMNWNVKNSISIYPVTNSDTYYYGTAGWGLVECSDIWSYDTIYNKSNSPIQNIYNNDTPYELITDIAMDSKKNLWVLNKNVDYPLLVKTANNVWYSFALSGLKSNLTDRLIIDKNGYKWIVGDDKVAVFNDNGTIDNTSDDQYTYISLTDDEGNIADRTTCIAADIDGTIWIGTTQGIAIHSTPSRVFTDKKTISRIKIEIDGEIGYLLSSEKITAIAVDGANRKWIGTQNSGIFLVSPDGTIQLQNFTVINSPLPSNTINSIAINQKTGEIYIATEYGLVSFIGDALWGAENMEDVYVFPNPIRETYDGDIYIKGTVSNAIIKITDISGNLVYQTISNGGMGVWNGKNLEGKRVSTGVYLIYISDEEGVNTKVTKLLFIK